MTIQKNEAIQVDDAGSTLGRQREIVDQYDEALRAALAKKTDQVKRLEKRLEGMIESEEVKLQTLQSKSPGFFALPSTKQKWQSQVVTEQQTLALLHSRLDKVRAITDSTKLNDFSVKKVRSDAPGLCSEFDELQEAGRKHQLEMKQKERQKKERGRTNVNRLIHSINHQ